MKNIFWWLGLVYGRIVPWGKRFCSKIASHVWSKILEFFCLQQHIVLQFGSIHKLRRQARGGGWCPNAYRSRNPNDHIFASTVCSAYNEPTWWCNMSYDWKFCQLSEYVQVQKVGPLIKSTLLLKRNSGDFDKFVNSQELVNFWLLLFICKLPWPMAITTPIM